MLHIVRGLFVIFYVKYLMENKELIILGIHIKYFRTELSLTQEALAFKCNFDRTYISLLERGKRNPSYKNLLKLSKGLNIPLSKLCKNIEEN